MVTPAEKTCPKCGHRLDSDDPQPCPGCDTRPWPDAKPKPDEKIERFG